ncbi:hypothetical protein OHA25_16595 [Nonomuraea sp. NBC_00507]|uniref:hypothetical protein n=1 Tax=Nonomuraea sp. NBC_00507 TaxID=2976002 RepID=UPI002E1734BC
MRGLVRAGTATVAATATLLCMTTASAQADRSGANSLGPTRQAGWEDGGYYGCLYIRDDRLLKDIHLDNIYCSRPARVKLVIKVGPDKCVTVPAYGWKIIDYNGWWLDKVKSC